MPDQPSTNGDNGRDRDERGRFTTGNSGGPGNPYARRVAQLRSALIACVTDDDLQQVASAMIAAAKGGDVAAARLLFDRVLGPAVPVDVIEKIEALEQAVGISR